MRSDTLKASASGMSIAMEAKVRRLELYGTGMNSSQIIEALGYSCEILGAQ